MNYALCIMGNVVDEVDVAPRACHGGVEPAVEVERGQRLARYAAHVDKHILPLAALRLVACHGIGHLDLKGVEVGVTLEGAVAGALVAGQL